MLPDVDEILKLRQSPCLDDVLAWAPDPKGAVIAKSAYNLALKEKYRTSTCTTSRAPNDNRAIKTTLWGCPAPPRYAFLGGGWLQIL